MKQYKVVSGTAPYIDAFESEVNEYLADGWDIAGGLQVESHEHLGHYLKLFQALVRERQLEGEDCVPDEES